MTLARTPGPAAPSSAAGFPHVVVTGMPRPAGGPAPVMWRPAGAGPVAPRRPVPPTRPSLARRLALWGAGEHGEHLAWGVPGALASAPEYPTLVPTAERPTMRRRVSELVRRLALWGAGPDGIHVAWNVPDARVFSGRLPVVPARRPAPRATEACFPSWTAWPVPAQRPSQILTQPRRMPQPRPTEPAGRLVVPAEPSRALHASFGRPVREMAPPRPGSRSGVRVAGRARTRGDPVADRVRGPSP